MDSIDIERDIAIRKLINIRIERNTRISTFDIEKLLSNNPYVIECKREINRFRNRSNRKIINFIEELTSSLSMNKLTSFLDSYKCPHPLSVH